MPAPPYRRRREPGLILGLFVSILLFPMAAIWLTEVTWGIERAGGWALAIAGGSGLAAVLMLMVAYSRAMKRLRHRIAEALEQRGFRAAPDPSAEGKAAAFVPVAHLEGWLGLRLGAEGINWWALRDAPEGKTLVFEHSYVTGSGRTTQQHDHTVVAWPSTASSPRGAWLGSAGELWMVKAPLGMRRALERQGEELPLADERLDKPWVVFGHEAVALAFLTPEVRERLSASPRGECWLFGKESVACAYKGSFAPDELLRFLDWAGEVLDRAPPRPDEGKP